MPFPTLGRLSSRQDLKPVNPGRHRNAPAKEAAEEVVDHELTSYLAALAPEPPKESTGAGKRFGEAQVYQLRVSLAASEQLKDIAAERGTSAQRLAHEWILERLSWESAQAEAERHPHLAGRQAQPVPVSSNAHTNSDVSDETEQYFFDAQWRQTSTYRD